MYHDKEGGPAVTQISKYLSKFNSIGNHGVQVQLISGSDVKVSESWSRWRHPILQGGHLPVYQGIHRKMFLMKTSGKFGLVWFNPLYCFFGSEGHVALDRNPGTGYDTLLLRMIPGDLLSAFPHRQFHTLPGLLDSWAALPNSYPNALRVMQGGSLYHFYDGLWYDPAERRTHDLPCERLSATD